MKKIKKIAFILVMILLIPSISQAQFDENSFSVSGNISLTTNAKLFLSPNSTDPILRNTYTTIENIWGYSVELRYRVSTPLIVGISAGYLEKTAFVTQLGVTGSQGSRTIDVDDGFRALPIELSAFYHLPFSTQFFKFLLGGGLGFYYGSHVRKIGELDVENVERQLSFGLQISVGLEYMIFEYLSARFQMKFRDPQFELKSKYIDEEFEYEGNTYRITQDEFDSKVNIDGTTFILGIAYHF